MKELENNTCINAMRFLTIATMLERQRARLQNTTPHNAVKIKKLQIQIYNAIEKAKKEMDKLQ